MNQATNDELTTPYDVGYASVDPGAVIGPNAAGLDVRTPAWGAATLKLHIGWMTAQLHGDPSHLFKRGRCDALCDLLARIEPLACD